MHEKYFIMQEWNKYWFWYKCKLWSSLLLFSHSIVSDSLQPHGLQQVRLPCPVSSPRVCSNSCPLRWWCHPIISCSVIPFSPFLQIFLLVHHQNLFQWVDSSHQMKRIGALASASVLPMNIHDWFPLGLTGLISLQCKGLWRVFSNTTVQKHQFFGTQPSLWSNSHISKWRLEKP